MKADELRKLAIDWLKKEYPDAVIVTEMSLADWGGASIDLAAITDSEIVGIEIKGEGDSPARLDLQDVVYGRVARKIWLLPDESIRDRCFAKIPSYWGKLEVWEGEVRPENQAKKLGPRVEFEKGMYRQGQIRDDSRYEPDKARDIPYLCPYSMCGTLWADELRAVVKLGGVSIKGKANVHPLTVAICEQLPAPTIHRLMIEVLRRRIWKKSVIDLRGDDQQEIKYA